MPPDQYVNPAEEPPPPTPATDSTTFSPGAPRPPVSRIRIQAQVIRIGRSPINDMVVSELGVSKQHAELRRTPAGRYSITDLGSHNGTYVNGTRISQQELSEGDVIAIGHATFRLVGGELTEHVTEPADSGADEELRPEDAKTALERERELVAELRRQLEAREYRIDALEAALRVLAAGNPAVLPALYRLGIRPEPEA